MTKNCLLCFISQEPYIIWLSFMVRMCKMIISWGVFFNLKFLFSRLSSGWKGKKWPKMMKFLSVAPYISVTIYHMIFIYSAHVCIKGEDLQGFFLFFIFFKILIFGIIRGYGGGGGVGKRAKNHPKWMKILFLSLCISGTVHPILWF